MPSTKKLNGLPNSIGESYLSTSKYYLKGYMADWLNSIAIKTNQYDINIDIITDSITPENCDHPALLAWNENFRSYIQRMLIQEGFVEEFITKAIMEFKILGEEGSNNFIHCTVTLEDENGKIYQNKKPIIDEAHKKPFDPKLEFRNEFVENENQIEVRPMVWEAISNFYLDTELEGKDYDALARIFSKSNLSIEQLKHIDKYEVFPTLQINLLGIAGEWAGFDSKWLNQKCQRNMKKSENPFHKFATNVFNPLFYWMRSRHWKEIEGRMKTKAKEKL